MSEPTPEKPASESGMLADLGARGLAAALRPLAGLAGMADDIRTMAADVARMSDNTEVLPDVTETLHAIRDRVEHMDREVGEMHAAVEQMRLMLEPVAGQLESVTRITDRIPGGRRRRAQAEAVKDSDEVARAHDAE